MFPPTFTQPLTGAICCALLVTSGCGTAESAPAADAGLAQQADGGVSAPGEEPCYSPTQNLGLAYEEGAIGCECSESDADVCFERGMLARVALSCQQGRWQGVEHGPCAPPPPGVGCEVDGVRYADGDTGIADPFSCNTCACDDGQLVCTELDCPVACEAGTIAAAVCAECGPAEGCVVVRHGCEPSCEMAEDCTTGLCDTRRGVCREVCG